MPTERPLILDRYRPLGLLGSGASGSVEVAWDTRIQRRVAIKRIPLNGDPDMAAETLTEARTAALLNHPAIVQVFDFEIDGPEALIIMEHVDGETLADLLNRSEDPLELDVVAAIAQPVAEALSYAHENQVLHLDIKPENVLISHDGMVKVSDFGLASLSNSLGFSAAKGGTIGYMPPEQIAGKLVDERTDEWAFASMVYEMLTAKNPFFATGLKRAYRAACYANVTPPSLVRDDVSPTIDGILLDALSPSPEVRFGSIDALRAVWVIGIDPNQGRKFLSPPFPEGQIHRGQLRKFLFFSVQQGNALDFLGRPIDIDTFRAVLISFFYYHRDEIFLIDIRVDDNLVSLF